eukprot:Lankesteria_metandrocarpae@DN4331_c1_g1_i1.p1
MIAADSHPAQLGRTGVGAESGTGITATLSSPTVGISDLVAPLLTDSQRTLRDDTGDHYYCPPFPGVCTGTVPGVQSVPIGDNTKMGNDDQQSLSSSGILNNKIILPNNDHYTVTVPSKHNTTTDVMATLQHVPPVPPHSSNHIPNTSYAVPTEAPSCLRSVLVFVLYSFNLICQGLAVIGRLLLSLCSRRYTTPSSNGDVGEMDPRTLLNKAELQVEEGTDKSIAIPVRNSRPRKSSTTAGSYTQRTSSSTGPSNTDSTDGITGTGNFQFLDNTPEVPVILNTMTTTAGTECSGVSSRRSPATTEGGFEGDGSCEVSVCSSTPRRANTTNTATALLSTNNATISAADALHVQPSQKAANLSDVLNENNQFDVGIPVSVWGGIPPVKQHTDTPIEILARAAESLSSFGDSPSMSGVSIQDVTAGFESNVSSIVTSLHTTGSAIASEYSVPVLATPIEYSGAYTPGTSLPVLPSTASCDTIDMGTEGVPVGDASRSTVEALISSSARGLIVGTVGDTTGTYNEDGHHTTGTYIPPVHNHIKHFVEDHQQDQQQLIEDSSEADSSSDSSNRQRAAVISATDYNGTQPTTEEYDNHTNVGCTSKDIITTGTDTTGRVLSEDLINNYITDSQTEQQLQPTYKIVPPVSMPVPPVSVRVPPVSMPVPPVSVRVPPVSMP